MVDQIRQILQMIKNGQIGNAQALELIKVLRDVQSQPKGSALMKLEINSEKGDIVRLSLPLSMVRYLRHFIPEEVQFHSNGESWDIDTVVSMISDGYQEVMTAELSDGNEMKVFIQE